MWKPQKAAGSRSFELKAFPLIAGLQPFTVVDSVTRFSNARLRPGTGDGLAYQSDTSGRSEVYLTRFPRVGAKFQVSQNGGVQPLWSRDGKTLYYLDDLQRIIAVSAQAGQDTVQLSPPKVLFQTGIRHSIFTGAYDVARDGRFLLVNSVVDSTAPVVLVTGWESELNQK